MIVALDFDGVIFDGTNECLLIAWNVFKKNRVKDFNIEVFDKIPTKFNILFKKLRNFVRHDGHFLVPFYIKEKMQGGMSSKVLSLEAMKSEAISRGQKILFIDDNIDNVIESINIGVDSFWATWGYHTAEHINKAKQFLIKEVEKENILSTIIDYKKEIKK